MYTLEQVVDNIESLYLDAGKPQGSNWFVVAKKNVSDLANKYDISFQVAAAVVAVLSPRIKWQAKSSMPNLDAADNLIKGFFQKKRKSTIFKSVAGFDHNKEKAWKILRSKDCSLVSGPKVWAFFQNIIDPYNDNYLTIDSWMTCIGLGLPYNASKDNIAPTKTQRELIQQALRIVAYGYGVGSAVELQAALWVYAKEQAGNINFRYQ